MTRANTPLADLSDDQLLAAVKRLAATDRCATAALVESLMRLIEELIALDRRAHHLARGLSPALLRFTVGTGLEIITRHQQRHLLQAERVTRESAWRSQ